MPRTLLGQSNNKYRKLSILLTGAVGIDPRPRKDACAAIGATDYRTIRKYVRNPEKLSLDKLLRLARNLNIPIEELRGCIQY